MTTPLTAEEFKALGERLAILTAQHAALGEKLAATFKRVSLTGNLPKSDDIELRTELTAVCDELSDLIDLILPHVRGTETQQCPTQ